MRGRIWIRQTHRWVAMLFTLLSAAIFLALAVGGKPADWVYYLPLLPLAGLVITGLYLFFIAYLPRGGGRERSAR